MEKELIAERIKSIAGEENTLLNEPMKSHTSFQVGGPADILVTPGSVNVLAGVYKACREMQVPVFIMGNGTNLVVRDKGIRGVVIKLADHFSRYEVQGNIIKAQAGMLISKVSGLALEHGLTGLEFAEGIPGTLGGAVFMNAGAYNGDIAGVMLRTEYLDENGELKVLYKDEHRFGKRTSFIQENGGIVVASELLLKKGDRAAIKTMMDDFRRQRREKQPLEMPSAGSVFKRPEGYFAGKLVQDCGLRGCRIGGAEVSNKHCGFIVNAENATAEDITRLIDHIRCAVKDRFHVELQTEVRIVGE